ncbi:methyltransferase [Actinacidiphila glaucinigra]|uniref:methyltransferase n=1 Tax=Actinacidiphila glaucinigra TaxID=235986 RepID=UPI0033B838E9
MLSSTRTCCRGCERSQRDGRQLLRGSSLRRSLCAEGILHDWDDASCELGLRNCHASAETGARLVVIENVIGTPSSTVEGAILDMNMLAISSGQERDLADFDALFAASGIRSRKALRSAVSPPPCARLITVVYRHDHLSAPHDITH